MEHLSRDELVKFLNDQLLTKQECMEITGQSSRAFSQAVDAKRVVPVFDKGQNQGRIRLFLRKEIEAYAVEADERRKRLKEGRAR
jgi:hypothetical protein